MLDENLKERIRNSVSTLALNTTPMNDRRYNLIEVLIECESNKFVSRCFRKENSKDTVVSERYYNGILGSVPFRVVINIDDYEYLENDWYEVSNLYV